MRLNRHPRVARCIIVSILLILLLTVFLWLIWRSGFSTRTDYHFEVVQPNCKIMDNGSALEVAYVVTVICDRGSIDTVNFTMPYGEQEILLDRERPWSEDLHVRENLTTKALQKKSQTTITVSLPAGLTKGLSYSLILRYTIHDLPGDKGMTRPVKTLLDLMLGRGPSMFKVRYRPPAFEVPVDNLNLRIFPPKEGDVCALDWRPVGGRLLGGPPDGPSDGKEWVYWSPVRNAKSPEYRLLLGAIPPLGQLHPYFRLFLSMAILVVIVTIAIRRINKRLEENGDSTGRVMGSLAAADIVLVVGVTVAVIGAFLQEAAPSMNPLVQSLVWSAISVVGVVIALLGAAARVPRGIRLGAGTVLLIVALIAMWVGSWFFDPYPVHARSNAMPVLMFGLGTVYLVLYPLIANYMI